MRLKRNVTYAGLMAVCLLQCTDGRDKATGEGNSARATTPTRPDARRAMTKGEALSAIRRANAKVRERLATFREVASSDMAVILAVLGQRGVSEDPKSREIVYLSINRGDPSTKLLSAIRRRFPGTRKASERKRCVMQCTAPVVRVAGIREDGRARPRREGLRGALSGRRQQRQGDPDICETGQPSGVRRGREPEILLTYASPR